MFKKILGTVITRVLVAVLTLALVLINARVLGAEKIGTISLVILAITIIQLVNNIVGGGALVYLVPRISLVRLLIPSYLWAIITALGVTGLLEIFRLFPNTFLDTIHLIPEGFSFHVLMLSMILSLASINFMLLMGQERIRIYNIITLLQMVILFGTLMMFFFLFGQKDISAYISSLYISYGFAFLAGFWMIFPSLRKSDEHQSKSVLKEIFHLGSVMQLGNILQFLNYRVSYYFIEFFLNRAAIGIYSVGVQLSESIWLVAKSIHMVQYTRISNEKDRQYASRLTINLLKIVFILTLICLVAVLVILNHFFSLLFKPAFHEVFPVMLALSLGILIFSVSIILSPYFSGTGRPHHNTISAAIGVVFTLTGSLVLIPLIGITGAAWAATLAYAAATFYQMIIFIRQTGAGFRDFLLKKSDIRLVKNEVINFLGRSKNDLPSGNSAA